MGKRGGGLHSFGLAKIGQRVWRVKCEVGLLGGVDCWGGEVDLAVAV